MKNCTVFFSAIAGKVLFDAPDMLEPILRSKRVTRYVAEDALAPPDYLVKWLCACDAISVPWAKLMLSQSDIPKIEGNSQFLCLTPVRLAPQRDHLMLKGTVAVPPSMRAGVRAFLVDSLQDIGIDVHIGQNGVPILCAQSSFEIVAEPWWRAWGRDIRPYLPKGPEAGFWQRMMNEWQMYLHTQMPVVTNASDDTAIPNSFWAWGNGCELPAPAQWDRIFADDSLTRLLAEWVGVTPNALADIAIGEGEKNLIVVGDSLPMIEKPGNDVESFHQVIDQLTKNQYLAALTLVFADGEYWCLEAKKRWWQKK